MIINSLLLILLRSITALIFVISPLSLGVWILISCIILSIFLSITLSRWYRILLFLIYIGGLLVIFSYFVALQPNQQLGFIKLIAIFRISFIYIKITLWAFKINTVGFNLISPPARREILTPFNISIVALLGLFLFFALIVVVKITYITKQPLRPFNYVFTYTKRTPGS